MALPGCCFLTRGCSADRNSQGAAEASECANGGPGGGAG